MALRQPKLPEGDPRRNGHETTFQGSRGGWVKPEPKPTPGKPKSS